MARYDIPSFDSPLARKAWVMAELKVRGLSFASLARANGWHPGAIANALLVPSDPQEKVLAAALGLAQADLFPERYGPDGQRLHWVKNSAAKNSSNVKTHEAA